MPLPPTAAFAKNVPAPNKWEKPEPSPGQPVLVDPAVKDKWAGLDDSYVVRAKILVRRPDGVLEVPLWLNTDVQDMPDFPVVESVTVEWGPGTNGQITVTMKMDYQMGRWFLDNEISRFGNLLVVQAGWPKADIWTPIFSGLTEAPQPSHDPMGYDITVTAKITGMRLGRLRYDMGKYIKGKTSRREVVRAFLEEAGFVVEFNRDEVTGREEDNEWLNSGIETGKVAGGRFWPEEQTIETFIAWVCLEANMKCIMWPHPETGEVYAFTFMNRASVMAQEVKKELVLFANVNVEKGIYPLMGFSSENPSVYMDRWMLGASGSDIDPADKTEKKVSVGEGTSKLPSHGEENAGVRASSLGVAALAPASVIKGNLVRSQDPTDPELFELALEAVEQPGYEAVLTTKSGHPMMYDAPAESAPGGVQIAAPVGRDSSEEGRMQSYYDEKWLNGGGIAASLKSLGMPDAHPMMLVNVRRVGARFDGTYLINKVTHTLSAGTWDTDFEAVKQDFPKGSGLLKSSRPIIPHEVVQEVYPAWTPTLESEQAGDATQGETPPSEEAI